MANKQTDICPIYKQRYGFSHASLYSRSFGIYHLELYALLDIEKKLNLNVSNIKLNLDVSYRLSLGGEPSSAPHLQTTFREQSESKRNQKNKKNTFDYIFGLRIFVQTRSVPGATSKIRMLLMGCLSCLEASPNDQSWSYIYYPYRKCFEHSPSPQIGYKNHIAPGTIILQALQYVPMLGF